MIFPPILLLAGGLMILFVVVLVWAIWTYNRLVRARNQQSEAWAGIDVQLRKRHDLVPALVETVRGYSRHESETLGAVVEARRVAMGDPGHPAAKEGELSRSLGQLFALAEAYPDLRADENFRQLSSQLVAVEDDLQYARRFYNGSVRDYRNLAQTFPSNLMAGLFAFAPGDFFEVEPSLRHAAPAVRL